MATMFDVSQQALVESTKEELKQIKEIQPPEWAKFVKTGTHKERVPAEEDWWYSRAASVLRVIALKGPIGVAKLRTKYGGKKNRGVRPEKFKVASGNILRKVLQQLESAGLAKQTEIGVHKGRIVTPAGQKLLDKAATKIVKRAPAKDATDAPAKKAEKPAAKPSAPKKEDKPDAKAQDKKEDKPTAAKEQDKKEDKPDAKEQDKKEDKPDAKAQDKKSEPAAKEDSVKKEAKSEE